MRPRGNPFAQSNLFAQGNPLLGTAAVVSAQAARRKKPLASMPAEGLAVEAAALIGFPGLGDNNTSIPPDDDGAVGPANLVVALNSQIEIQTRTGTPISTVSTLSFWSSLGVGSITDPRVIYDPYGQRWVIVFVRET